MTDRGLGLALAAALLVAAGSCVSARRPAPPPAAEAEPPPAEPGAAPVPAPPSPGPPASPAPRPEPPPAPPLLPATLRIGLETDLDVVTLPCCDGAVTARVGDEELAVVAPVTVRPAAAAVAAPVWRLQVAALRELEEARGLARRLERLAGATADARLDAGSGLYRVRLGRWPTRAEAEQAGRRLQGRGLDAFWVVSEGGGVTAPALQVVQRGRSWRVEGRRFVLSATDGGALSVAGRRYRGAIAVFLNDRGRLNVVNELPLEAYLRGVVPRELGPGAYPALEALKAQAVAARSYAVRNLGEFDDEGYDLCGTPKCQVYGGLGAEHPLSDRAVAETEGEVALSGGLPIDALYSATCGGHTEDVEVIFPLKSAAYLRGVPCIEDGLARWSSTSAPEWPRAVTAAALPEIPARVSDAADLERALRALAGAAGLETAPDRLASLERREVLRFVGSLFDLALDARVFLRAAEGVEPIERLPDEASDDERRLASWLTTSRLVDAHAPAELDDAAAQDLLFRLALRLGLVEERSASFEARIGDDLLVREAAGPTGYVAGREVAVFLSDGDSTRAVDLTLAAGDELALYFAADRLVAVVQRLSPAGEPPGRAHARASWTRWRSDADVAAAARQRFPGFELARFDIGSRGVSGRVGALRLEGRDGSTVEVSGLAVRWLLDVPDTLFTLRRTRATARRNAGWELTGRGWGHGVGLCQVGAYAMARRGHDYRAILGHYYTGVEVVRLATAGAAE